MIRYRFILVMAALFAVIGGATAAPNPVGPSKPAPPKTSSVEVRCFDGSVLKLKLLDDKLEFTTKYGILQIPANEIRKIEFASRTAVADTEKIANAIIALGSSQYKVREQAMEELKTFKERAYPAALAATKNGDTEVKTRADKLVAYFQANFTPEALEVRLHDVVEVGDSKIVGKFTAEWFRVETTPFGEQQLKLSDMRSLRSAIAAKEVVNAPLAPTNMANQSIGKEYLFSVTGPQPGTTGSLWGTNVYTLDSNIASAAMHAGLLKPGETKVLRIRTMPSLPQYVGSVQNGVTSADYGAYPSGAYLFVRDE